MFVAVFAVQNIEKDVPRHASARVLGQVYGEALMPFCNIIDVVEVDVLYAFARPCDYFIRMDAHEIVGRYLIDYNSMEVVLADQIPPSL